MRYRVFDWDKGMPWTNNVTEPVIGRLKAKALNRSRDVGRVDASGSGVDQGLDKYLEENATM